VQATPEADLSVTREWGDQNLEKYCLLTDNLDFHEYLRIWGKFSQTAPVKTFVVDTPNQALHCMFEASNQDISRGAAEETRVSEVQHLRK